MNALPNHIIQVAFDKSEGESLTEEERAICEEWNSGELMENTKIDINDPLLFTHLALFKQCENNKEKIWENILSSSSMPQIHGQEAHGIVPPSRRIGKRVWLAAAVLTGLSIGVYFLLQVLNAGKNQAPAKSMVAVTRSIEPGRNRAVLMLADNKKIDLDTIPTGIIAYEDQMEISKQADNQIVYKVSDNHKAGTKVVNNSLTTPYGGEYKVTLADGSTVWLNAGSSLHYPAVFNGNDRPVEITGEGYFEVAENKAKPFRVFANGTEVKVLGTKFNVKAYGQDKQIIATLVTGSVAIQHGTVLKNIKPNQQAIVFGDEINIKTNSKEEMEQVLAWKNGLINLEGESVASILQQIERWYNVKTQIEAGTPETTLTGTIERTTPLPKVLELLNTNMSVQFTLDGETVVAREKK